MRQMVRENMDVCSEECRVRRAVTVSGVFMYAVRYIAYCFFCFFFCRSTICP